jgi:hypothetical protein
MSGKARVAGEPVQTDASIRCPPEQDHSQLTSDIREPSARRQVADWLATATARLDGAFVGGLYGTDGTEMVKA